MSWYQNWRAKRAIKKQITRELLDLYEATQRGGDPVAVVDPDGFIPDTAFVGGTLEENLEASIWSYAAVTSNAEAIASLPAIVQRQEVVDNKTKWVKDTSHPLNGLLREPFGNKYSKTPPWSWQKLYEVVGLQVQLGGNSFLQPIAFDRNQKLAVKLWRRPETVQAETDDDGYPLYYDYNGGQYGPREICNIQSAHPSSFWKGHSAFKAAQVDITIDQTGHSRTLYNLKNRLGSGVVISKEGFSHNTTSEQKLKILRELKKNYQASTQDGTPLVVSSGTKITPIPQQDIKYVFDVRKMSREGIMAATKVPPPILGVYENATLQNFATSKVIWWTNCLFPLAGHIYSEINQQIIWPRYGYNIRLWYDVTGSDIGLVVVRERAEVCQVLVKLGYPTNVAADYVGLGLPHHPALDEPNLQLKVAGREETTKPAEPVDKKASQ